MERADLATGLKISSLVGMPIYSLENGRKIGSVKDVLYDSEHSRLMALTVEDPGIISPDRRILLFDRLSSIGKDAVMVENEGLFVTEREAPEVSRILSHKSGIIGRHILTRSGNSLGSISDILIDTKTGEAVSYEVSSGLARDIGKGRGYIAAPAVVIVGYDAVIAPDEIEAMLEEQEPGGLAAAYIGAREQARTLGQTATSYLQEQEISLSRGKTAGKDVYSDSGELIVAKGDIITEDVIERAVREGKMHQIAASAGVAGAAERYARARSSTLSAYERTREMGYTATAERLKGKEVPRDIYDDQGQLIIPRGTIIDNGTIELAREAGVMQKLAATVIAEGARGRGESVWEETRERLSEAWSDLTERSKEAADRVSRRRTVAAQKEFLKGKVSATDIRDDQGNLIVSEGEVFTPLNLDNLDRAGRLERVVLMPEGQPALGPIEEEEAAELHVIVESPEEHKRH